MSDDIVTRLRAYNIGNIGHEASFHMEETLYEAADEIERLLEEVEHWRRIAETEHAMWANNNNAAVGDINDR